MDPIYIHKLTIMPSDIDMNDHASNIEFVRWMQDAAIAHSDAAGCTATTAAEGATWVIRSHHIEYRRPAFVGEQIEVRTWVVNLRRAFSLRRYEFVRPSDGILLARGETDWVFFDIQTGRPRSIPESIQKLFTLLEHATHEHR